MKKARLSFAPGLDIEFVDRDRAIQQVLKFAEKGTRFPIVVFGPEGCGKTAWLKQSIEILKNIEFDVIYFNPMRREFFAEVGIESIREKALEIANQMSSEYILAKSIWSVIKFARDVIKLGRKSIAVIVDDAFHLIGSKEASLFIKGLLELIEYPPENYERIVAIAATSEGASKNEIGRHLWAILRPMWNMSKRGFEELYDKVPGSKPRFEDVWLSTSGNPRALSLLYQVEWNINIAVDNLAKMKGIRKFIASLSNEEKEWLSEAIEDPDTLLTKEHIPLLDKLVELNLVIDNIEGCYMLGVVSIFLFYFLCIAVCKEPRGHLNKVAFILILVIIVIDSNFSKAI